MSARLLLVIFTCCAVSLHAATTAKTIVFLGDSITAGYGLDNPVAEAYPALIQQNITAAGLAWRVLNAGLSGDTTAGGLRRTDWILRQPVDLLVIALGGNDGLRGINPETTRANLQAIIDRARQKQPSIRIVLVGMQMPANMSEDFTRRFRELFPALATRNHLPLIPFLLEGVGGIPELNQPDLIHPTAEGQKRVAENVWAALHPLLS
ncbi:MAG: arylesterase [Opitutaceae bacterium]|nr:arylesterase [Opitutaceae bacterium]MBP9913881.1 arylesterase [Opitutaceae bacterium]